MKTCTKEQNMTNCNCSFPCSKKGICCDCLSKHRSKGQLPACYFPDDIEKTADRSIENFIKIYQERGKSYLK